MLISGMEFDEQLIARIRGVVKSEPEISRRALSRRICEWLDWRGDNGRVKDVSCRKALNKLAGLGAIELPASKMIWPAVESRGRTDTERLEVEAVRCELGDLGEIEIEAVGDRRAKSAQLWKTMMEQYHYLGSGPICGAQIRYLIRSSRIGVVGGLSFSSAAWRVGCRDEYIGWSDRARGANLKLVVSNSRFLILPTLEVKNLASHVLSRCVRQIGNDWQQRYGVHPVLLESYVDSEQFTGTCYRAANWLQVGKTAGRGRQDRNKKAGVSAKFVYLYRLRPDWQQKLCHETPVADPDCHNKRPDEPSDWAEEEFGGAALGDTRLRKRLIQLGRDFYGRPQANIPQACGSRAKTKAAYRFFKNRRVTMDKMLQGHYEQTARRVSQHRVVLAVQDTTTLSYTAHPATAGLGPTNTKSDGAIGLLLHDTLAFTVQGTPLGLVDIQCWARDPEEAGKSASRATLPIEEKESIKWLNSYRTVAELQKKCPNTMLVSVADREADVHDLFAESLADRKAPDLLVRSERSRQRKSDTSKLWEMMPKQPLAGSIEVRIPRRDKQKARTAQLEVRFRRCTLTSPKLKKHLPPVPVWVVYLHEIDPPPQVKEPIEWLLLTTVETNTFEDACERIDWYTKRWPIEVYHRTLKSGCKIEDRQLGTADRIEACLAIDLVVAWRVFYLVKQGRETPDLPCTVFFEDDEWQALCCFVNQTPTPPGKPPTLHQALRMVATRLGGFLGRKSDGEPGPQTTWRGLQRLDDITATYRIFTGKNGTVPSKLDYG